MNEAYIVDMVRLPRAQATAKGAYSDLTPVDLLKPLFIALTERQPLNPIDVEDVLLGCATQSGEQGANIGKIASLYAGWPAQVSGVTLNRFCCSGQDAINLAAAKIMSGMESLVVAGGVEHLGRVPMFSDQGAWFSNPEVSAATRFMHMGLSADLLAVQHGYERARLDEFSLRSHQRAARAINEGRFDGSLVKICDDHGSPLLQQDDAVRTTASLESMARLPAAFTDFVAQGAGVVAQVYPQDTLEARHSVANAPALVDGASLVLLGSGDRCRELGLQPRARVRFFSNASDEPVRMLTGHIRSTEKLLKSTGLQAGDIDFWEVNESFAASVLLFQESFSIPDDKLNVNGGAIALGHPLGATGGNLLATLVDILEQHNTELGIVSICGGAGVGVTTLVERLPASRV